MERKTPTTTDILMDVLVVLQEQAEVNRRVANTLEELVEIVKELKAAQES